MRCWFVTNSQYGEGCRRIAFGWPVLCTDLGWTSHCRGHYVVPLYAYGCSRVMHRFSPFPWRDASIGQLCFDACRWALNVHSTPQHRDIPSSHDLCNTRARSSWHLFASHLARVTLFRHFRPWPFALALLAFARLGPLSVDLRTADQATVTRSILARRWVLLVLGHHRAFQRLPGCAALHTLKTLVHYLRQQ